MYLNRFVNIPDPIKSIISPIVEQTVYRLIEDTGLERIFTADNIYLNSDESMSSQASDANGNAILKGNRFECNIQPNFNPNTTLWGNATPIGQFTGNRISKRQIESRIPIYADVEHNVILTDHTFTTSILMECAMKFIHREEAFLAMERLRRRYEMGSVPWLKYDNFVYEYVVPPEIESALYLLYRMSGRPIQNFYTFLRETSRNRLVVGINSQLPNQPRHLLVQTSNAEVAVGIEWTSDKPDVEKTNRTIDQRILSFTIKFSFARPDLLCLRYPIVVHNQSVPATLINSSTEVSDPKVPVVHPEYDAQVRLYQQQTETPPATSCVRFPWYDPWVVNCSTLSDHQYTPVMAIAFLLENVEDEEGVTVLDLVNGLEAGWALTDVTIAKLKEQGVSSVWYDGQFNITIFRDDDPIEPSQLWIEEGTLIKFRGKMLNHLYHLVLSEKTEEENGIINVARVTRIDYIAKRK